MDEKILSAKALTGGEVKFEQTPEGIALTLLEKDRHSLNTVIALKLDRPVSRIYPGSRAFSIFDGPGYGELISGSAMLEPSSHGAGQGPALAVQTKSEASPWIAIDLDTRKQVKGVRITNPPDITKANGLELLVSEDKVNWSSVWKAQTDSPVWEVPVTQFTAGAHVPRRGGEAFEDPTPPRKSSAPFLAAGRGLWRIRPPMNLNYAVHRNHSWWRRSSLRVIPVRRGPEPHFPS